ncbi:phosphatase PAP2 family protein [Planosporangium sp. 12N6]
MPERDRADRPSAADVRPHPVRELVLVATLFTAYKLGRAAVDDRVATAFHNARAAWGLERWLHLPSERSVQALLLDSDVLVHGANIFYAYVHFPATAAFLLWMYLRRPAHYRWARRSLAVLTAAAFVIHVLVPLAPPRMLAGISMIDTGAVYGPAVYGPPQTDELANQYAALPSLHVGWALMVAIGIIVTTRHRWRWCWLAHPAVTLVVVVGTANHYWVDAIVATALLAVTLSLPHRLLSAPRAADDGPHRGRVAVGAVEVEPVAVPDVVAR